jgi:hypothetical protein
MESSFTMLMTFSWIILGQSREQIRRQSWGQSWGQSQGQSRGQFNGKFNLNVSVIFRDNFGTISVTI